MTVPQITAVRLGGSPRLPLLVLGPSLGTSARALWSSTAAHLADRFEVVAWDLPGHGTNPIVARPFTMAELAAGVLAMIDDMLAERGTTDDGFVYAGDSVGGAVGLHLLLDAPRRVDGAVLLCTGATIGDPAAWHDRAALVRASGTAAVADGSAARWFAPCFLDREPDVGGALLRALRDADPEGYAQVCEALAGHDVRDRLGAIGVPVLAVAGREDAVTPVDGLRAVADGVRHGRLVVLEGVAHLPPAEAPEEVARLIRAFADGEDPEPGVPDDEFAADAQELVTQHASGAAWARTGLDPRSRSLVTLAALVARGDHDAVPAHVRAARANGLTDIEIRELLLQTAAYCGVPDARTAFGIAQRVLAEQDERGSRDRP